MTTHVICPLIKGAVQPVDQQAEQELRTLTCVCDLVEALAVRLIATVHESESVLQSANLLLRLADLRVQFISCTL